MNAPVKLSNEEVQSKVSELDGWSWDQESNEIVKTYEFKGYWKTIGFVNTVAWHAQKEVHHPDLKVSFGKCEVRLTTHDCDGISQKDFKLAAILESL